MMLHHLLPILSLLLLLECPTSVNAVVAGVDFGGEFFKVALVQPGSPFEIVTNVHSKRKTETMVAFDGEDRLYGADAANIGVRRPKDAFCQIRRFIGNTPEHPFVQDLLSEEYMPYELLANASRGHSIGLRHSNDVVFHAEELVAMVFNHAREITNEYARANVKDWVITYPMFFTQAQKQALLDAASLINVRVLSLIEENTAAALQLGIDTVNESPKTILYYNMGSTSTQVSVVTYSSYVIPDGFKKNKTVGMFEVRGKAYDETLGGASFDLRLANHLANVTNTQFKLTEDIRSQARPWAKLRALAKKTKIVLSANAEIPVVSQSLYNDMDLHTHVSRAEFENMCDDLFDRVLQPVTKVLSDLSLTPADIAEVEIIGGGVRVPKVQQLLKSYFNNRELSVHLNGDEAMALGAAFRGANISNAFRVRNVGMVDITPVSIGVDIKSSSIEKSPILFQAGSAIDVKKTVSFSTNDAGDDFIGATLKYIKSDDAKDAVIGSYSITGAAEFIKKLQEEKVLSEDEKVKVAITFTLDASSMVSIKSAVASYEQEIIEESESTESEEDASKTEEKEKKFKKHKQALNVTYTSSAASTDASHILPMSFQDKSDSIAMLNEMQRLDDIRREIAEAKNELEAFVYSSRDTLRSSSEEIVSSGVVASEDDVSTLLEEINENEEWLYDEGESGVDAMTYKGRYRSIKSKLDGMLYRLKEVSSRPAAVKRVTTYVEETRSLMNEWAETKEQVTETERQNVLDKLKDMEEWLNGKVTEQEGLALHDTPVFGSQEVLAKLKEVKRYVVYLSKKPVLPPPTAPPSEETNSTTTSSNNETSTEDKDETSSTTTTTEDEEKKEDEELKASEDVEETEENSHSEL